MKWLFSCLVLLLSCLCSSSAQSDDEAMIKLRQSTVHIAIGSGFIVEGPSGAHYLATNGHVCNAGSWLGVMRANYEGGQLVEGKITKTSMAADLCVTKVSKSLSALKVAKTLEPNQQVYTRGYPYGVLSETSGEYIGIQSWDYTYPIDEVGECFKGSRRVLNGQGRVAGCAVKYTDNVTNMYSRPGSSGSPVVDASGDLVGVMSSWIGEQDAGGMVTLQAIKEFMRGL